MRVAFTIIFLGWWLTRKRWMTQGEFSQYPKPSISVIPSGEIYLGENVTISCKSEHYRHITFILGQPGDGIIKVKNKEQTEKGQVNFFILNAKKDDEGNYVCSYYFNTAGNRRAWSNYSDEVAIRVRDQVYPKPSISISPNKMVALGEDFTIHCQAQEERPADLRLMKKRAFNPWRVLKIERNGTRFYFKNITHSHGGIYRCRYQSRQVNQFSYVSDQVNINITDPKLPRPSIKGRIKSRDGGENAEIDCEGPEKGLTFSLFKVNSWMASQMSELDQNGTQFSLNLMKLGDKEIYTCRYQDRRNAFVWSEPSESMRLSLEAYRSVGPMIHLGLAILILKVLLLIVVAVMYSWRK